MKKFFLQCTLFGIIILLILSVIEISIRRLPNSYSFKKEWMDRNAGQVRTLILGSSYAAHGINPTFLADSSFNLAFPGQSVKYDLALLKKYIAKMPNLKRVILGIGYQIPFFMDYDHPNILPGNKSLGTDYYIAWYKIYMDIDFSPFPLHSFELLSYKRAIIKWKEAYIQRHPQMNCDSTGFDYDTNLKGRPQIWYNAKSVIQDNTASGEEKEKVRQLCKNYLEEIILLLEKHHAELIIVVTPTYHTFYENIDQSQMAYVYQAVKELENQYTNVRSYDYFKDERFTEDDFYNSNHLSDIGAQKLTLILKDTLLTQKQED